MTYSHAPSPQALAADGGGDVPGWPGVHGGRVCATEGPGFGDPPHSGAGEGGLHKHLAHPPAAATEI